MTAIVWKSSSIIIVSAIVLLVSFTTGRVHGFETERAIPSAISDLESTSLLSESESQSPLFRDDDDDNYDPYEGCIRQEDEALPKSETRVWMDMNEGYLYRLLIVFPLLTCFLTCCLFSSPSCAKKDRGIANTTDPRSEGEMAGEIPLISDQQGLDEGGHVECVNDGLSEDSVTQEPSKPCRLKRIPRPCLVGYTISILALWNLFYLLLFYYKRETSYNVCIFDADYGSFNNTNQTLDLNVMVSVKNPNNVDGRLQPGGEGYLYHKGVQVATFQIPPVTLKANSIRDVELPGILYPTKEFLAEVASKTLVVSCHYEVDYLANFLFFKDVHRGTARRDSVIDVYNNEPKEMCVCDVPPESDTTRTSLL